MSHPEMGHRSHLSLKCEIEPWTIGSGAEWSWGRRPAHSLRQECSRDPDERRPQKPPAVSVWMLLPRDGWRRLGVRAAHSRGARKTPTGGTAHAPHRETVQARARRGAAASRPRRGRLRRGRRRLRRLRPRLRARRDAGAQDAGAGAGSAQSGRGIRRERQGHLPRRPGVPAARVTEAAPGLLRRTFRALRIYNYRLFFISQVVSMSGTWMQSVAQSWLVLQLTGSG